VTYITPFTTIGEVSRDSLTSVWKIRAACRRSHVRGVDLAVRIEALLGVVAVGVRKLLPSVGRRSSMLGVTAAAGALLVPCAAAWLLPRIKPLPGS